MYSSVSVPVLQGEAEGGGKQSPSVALRAAAPDRLKRAAPAGVSRPSGTDRLKCCTSDNGDRKNGDVDVSRM